MIEVRPLADAAAIDSVLREPSIAAKLEHAGREPGYIDHPLASYWGAYVDAELAGVFLAVRFTQWEIEAHVAILREHVRHSRALAALFLSRCFEDEEVGRVTAYVMDTLPSAANFCRKLGFADEGRRHHAWRRDDEWRDVLILGLTRQDWVLRNRGT